MMRRLHPLSAHENHSPLMRDIATARGFSISIPLFPSLSFSLPLCAAETLHTNKAYICVFVRAYVYVTVLCAFVFVHSELLHHPNKETR